MIEALLHYQFMQYALISSLLASFVCGIIGVIIVEKKLVMMSGGIAHTAYGGVGLGYLLGFEPILGAFGFAIAASLGLGYIKKRGGAKSDVIIALFWSLGMALGIVFVALAPEYPPDLSSYLFGNILSVRRSDIYIMLGVAAITAFIIFVFYNDWKIYLFDGEFAKISGLKTTLMEYTLLLLIALNVVALIRVAGIILVIALLSAPAALSALISKNLKNRIFLSMLFGAAFCIIGLFVSYEVNVSSGAVIIVVSSLVYFISYIISTAIKKGKKHRI